jgi:hypothetical protein
LVVAIGYISLLGFIVAHRKSPLWIGFALPVMCLGAWLISHGMGLVFGISSHSESAAVSSKIGASAPSYGRAEDVRVVPIAISPSELGNVQLQIFAADLVKASHDAQKPSIIVEA